MPLLLLLVTIPAVADSIVSFPASAYANLGDLRTLVSPVYQQVVLTGSQLPAEVRRITTYANLLSNSSQSALDESSNFIIHNLALASRMDLPTLTNLLTSLNNSDSPILGISPSLIHGGFSALSGAASQSLAPSPLLNQLSSALAVSSNARMQASTLGSELQMDYANLSAAPYYLQASIINFDTGIYYASESALLVNQIITSLQQQAATSEAQALAVQPALDAATSLYAKLNTQVQQATAAVAELQTLTPVLTARIGEVKQTLDLLNTALQQPTLPSDWTTSGYNQAGASPLYAAGFDGRTFHNSFGEIDGPFVIGTIFITNINGPDTDGASADFEMTFEVSRTIDDPILGTMITHATSDLLLRYFVTANTGDRNQSADYVWVPSLGIYIHVYEGATAEILVSAEYDSPLRTVSLEIAPGTTGGFITDASPVPEPATMLLGFGGLLGCYFARKISDRRNSFRRPRSSPPTGSALAAEGTLRRA